MMPSKRFKPKMKRLKPDVNEDDGPDLFIAKPTDDIPRNKLVERLARGLQSYI